MNAQMQLPSSDDNIRLRDFFKGHFKAAFEESRLTREGLAEEMGAISDEDRQSLDLLAMPENCITATVYRDDYNGLEYACPKYWEGERL